jgi:M6 family metalloprotease-like protein
MKIQLYLLLSIAMITSCVSAPKLNPIPALNGKSHKTEGETDHKIYPKAVGKVPIVLLFVDFPDAHAEKETPEDVFKILTGNGDMQKWLKEQSYGKFSFDFTLTKGWKRMPKNSNQYESRTTNGHRDYLEAAAALYDKVDFSKFKSIIVIPPRTSKSGGSAAFASGGKGAIKIKDIRIPVGVTFGTSIYRQRFTLFVHEAFHTLGLPDLYSTKTQKHTVGPWDLMCDIYHSKNFMGWHRHKLKWLDADRKHYVPDFKFKGTLTPLAAKKGISMLVLPLNDKKSPSKVAVIELAVPLWARDNTYHGSGVLIYTVDAKIGSGHDPVVLVPKGESKNGNKGTYFDAPWQVKDTVDVKELPFTVKIISTKDKNYTIQISPK